VPGFSQDHSSTGAPTSSTVQQTPDFRTPPVATGSEPWRIIPKSDKDKGFVLSTPGQNGVVVSPNGPLAADTMCYAIRSYVVKRDSKNSDSVHPVGYSTCVPANRYRLKTADANETISLTR
jgi:hypothetical protein